MNRLRDIWRKLKTSYVTSSAGLSAMSIIAMRIFHNVKVHTAIDWSHEVPALIVAFGLLWAKDFNVTGGSKSETHPPEVPKQ